MNTLFYKAFLPRFYEQDYEQTTNKPEHGTYQFRNHPMMHFSKLT
jgi:hypothetical protein